MSLIQVQGAGASERTASPVLSSNNPFRNRTSSPSGSTTQSPINATFDLPSAAPERPTSRNPFLDHTETSDAFSTNARPTSPLKESSTMSVRQSPSKPQVTVELFDKLSLNNGSSTNGHTTQRDMLPAYSSRPRPENRENVAPRQKILPPGHQLSRSQGEGHSSRSGAKPGRHGTEGLNIFADPPPGGRPRLRRNSDSSIASRLLSPEEERRLREKHRREREARHKDKDGKPRAHGSSRSKKPNQRLDIIDSLDVTSIYGKGLFHHDGPFDACNPDRNRKGSRRAPMEAFAKDSANNVIGGSGPVNKNLDLAQFHGRGVEGFTDYSTSGSFVNPPAEPGSYMGSSSLHRGGRPKAGEAGWREPGMVVGGHGAVRPEPNRQSSFVASESLAPIHAQESMGLGSSTFLEGAPAPKSAIHRRESDNDLAFGGADAGGLGRKRSLAQRIRGISNAGRDRGAHRPVISTNNRVTSPTGIERTVSNTRPGLVTGESQSAGGMPKIHETKPFFQDYSSAEQSNTAGARRDSFGGGEDTITVGGREVSSGVAETGGAISHGRAREMDQGERGRLERRITHDGVGADGGAAPKEGGGRFLNRVKSLKGGKKKGLERKE